MKRPKRVGIVFGIIAIGLLMMPMLVGAQEGSTIEFTSDSAGVKANGFMSNDEPDAGARFFDSSGSGLEIIELTPPDFINGADPLLCVRGDDGSSLLRVEFDERLADFSIQVSILDENQEYSPDFINALENPTVTVRAYLSGNLLRTVTLPLNVGNPLGYYLTVDLCGIDPPNDNCLDVLPNGFDAIEIEFSHTLPEYADNFFGNPLIGPPTDNGCASLQGAAYGLCTAYCEAMDCDGSPQASAAACERVLNNFVRASYGEEPPCLQ